MKVLREGSPDMTAELSTAHSASSYGRAVLVFGDSVAVGPAEVAAQGLELDALHLARGEALALAELGYLMAFALAASSGVRLRALGDALLADLGLPRSDDEEPWGVAAKRVTEHGRRALKGADVLDLVAERLPVLAAREIAGQMSDDDRSSFTRQAWAGGISRLVPDCDAGEVLDVLERLLAEGGES
ncbi:MAG: hypothetical protein JXR96_26960 [Deltaproteobacteria bacterium]|nr:hypothetical protein [Deltaproteobacteria bacterium]